MGSRARADSGAGQAEMNGGFSAERGDGHGAGPGTQSMVNMGLGRIQANTRKSTSLSLAVHEHRKTAVKNFYAAGVY